MIKGVDYSFTRPPVQSLIDANIGLAVRYVSSPGNPKNLDVAERDALLGAGIAIVLVYETTGDFLLAPLSYAAGVQRQADLQRSALGLSGSAIYYALDLDATGQQTGQALAFLGAVAAAEGLKSRVGLYGGYPEVNAALDAGYRGFQTYAWSGGRWDPRAPLRQVQNDQQLGGASVDYDEASSVDLGQYPVFQYLRRGSTGPRVRLLQRLLGGLAVDGAFGPLTEGATRAFQERHLGQVGWADGIVGPRTAPVIGLA